jgi:hypothetical protein
MFELRGEGMKSHDRNLPGTKSLILKIFKNDCDTGSQFFS